MSPPIDATREVAVVGDGTWLTVSEAAKRLGFHQDKVRQFADDGYLRTRRSPARKGYGHRRIHAASIDELGAILDRPAGLEREELLRALRRRNRGEDDHP
jgi:excisionase family DNA binding protein